MTNKNNGSLLAALSGMLYGTLGWFGITIVNQGVSIPTMLTWRFLLAGIIAFVFLPFFFRIQWKTQRKLINFSFVLKLVIALLLASISTLTYFISAQKIGTGLGMVIYFSFPCIVVLLSWFLEKKSPSPTTFLAIGGILLGCLLIANIHDQKIDLNGMLLALLSGLTYALYIVWNKKMLPHIHSALMTGFVCLGNSVILFGIALLDQSFTVPSSLNLFFSLFAMAFFATALPSLFMLEAMKLTSANLVSILAVFEPLVTLIIGMLFLKEPATFMQLVGAALILISAVIAQRKKKIELEAGI